MPSVILLQIHRQAARNNDDTFISWYHCAQHSRRLVQENDLSCNDLIWPIFLREGKNKIESIKSMPGIKRYTLDKLSSILNKVREYKIPMVALFPYTEKKKKNIARKLTLLC